MVATKFGWIRDRGGSYDNNVCGDWCDSSTEGRICCGASCEGENFEATWYLIAMYCMDGVGIEYCTIRATSHKWVSGIESEMVTSYGHTSKLSKESPSLLNLSSCLIKDKGETLMSPLSRMIHFQGL